MPTASESPLSFGFNLPFAEQAEFLRQKLNLGTKAWDDIMRAEHDRSFVVAGAMKADLLADLHDAVQKAIDKGTTLETFRKDFREIVAKRGWHGWTGEGTQAGEAWRTRIIYETNLATSYAAGRYAQLTDPDLLARRPYWKYVHDESVTHPRPEHLAWDGLTLRHDHPFWETHYPPNGWGCQCRVTAVAAPEEGDKTEPPKGWDAVNLKTGAPAGIDKGWNYAPGASVADDLRKIVAEKAEKLPEPLSKEVLAQGLQSDAFAKWLDAPAKGTAWPLVRLPDADAKAIGAKEGVRVGKLSDETVEKQKRPDKHPELSAAEYAKAQSVVDHPTHKIQERPNSMIYVREELTETTGGYVLVVKATQTGEGIFITSLRRLSRSEAERDSEIARLLKNKGMK